MEREKPSNTSATEDAFSPTKANDYALVRGSNASQRAPTNSLIGPHQVDGPDSVENLDHSGVYKHFPNDMRELDDEVIEVGADDSDHSIPSLGIEALFQAETASTPISEVHRDATHKREAADSALVWGCLSAVLGSPAPEVVKAPRWRKPVNLWLDDGNGGDLDDIGLLPDDNLGGGGEDLSDQCSIPLLSPQTFSDSDINISLTPSLFFKFDQTEEANYHLHQTIKTLEDDIAKLKTMVDQKEGEVNRLECQLAASEAKAVASREENSKLGVRLNEKDQEVKLLSKYLVKLLTDQDQSSFE